MRSVSGTSFGGVKNFSFLNYFAGEAGLGVTDEASLV